MSFYKQLKPVLQIQNAAHSASFFPAPVDWFVFVADVKGSTDLISSARYRDVNLIAAAVIAAAINVMQSRDFPFAFGGDGASLLIPPEKKDPILQALRSIKAMAKSSFDIDLRVGLVQVQSLNNQRKDLLVSKLQLAPNNYLALFLGGGMLLAEAVVKEQDADADNRTVSAPESSADLRGLSCRWAPFKTKYGVIISIVVKATHDDFASQNVYFKLLEDLQKTLGRSLYELNPLLQKKYKFANPLRSIIRESKLSSRWITPIKTFLQLAMIFMMKTLHLSIGKLNLKTYLAETPANCDYVKLDDVLRIVLDISVKEKEQIVEILEIGELKGLWKFGLQESTSMIMTCFVEETSQNQHIHFIDGSDGGHALAAKQLKLKLKGKLENAQI